MKTFRVQNNEKGGQIAYYGKEVIGSITLGPRGGQWGANGTFNQSDYNIIKGDGKTVETNVDFGTRNAKRYNAVIYRFFVYEERLYACILKKTSKWIHSYHWEIVRKS